MDTIVEFFCYRAGWKQHYLRILLKLVLFSRIIISLKMLFSEFEKETFETIENWKLSSLFVQFCRCIYLKIKLFIYVSTHFFIIFKVFRTIKIFKFPFYRCFKVYFYCNEGHYMFGVLGLGCLSIECTLFKNILICFQSPLDLVEGVLS